LGHEIEKLRLTGDFTQNGRPQRGTKRKVLFIMIACDGEKNAIFRRAKQRDVVTGIATMTAP
jgi:hypothetical protein